jgi:hypothetical protein
MEGKVLNSRFRHLTKFISGGQRTAQKTVTSHIREPLRSLWLTNVQTTQQTEKKIKSVEIIMVLVKDRQKAKEF